MLRGPRLTACDHCVLDLPRARQPGERLLPRVMPVDQVEPSDLHGGVDPGANAAGSVRAQDQPQLPDQPAQVSNEPTGLQVALQSQNLQQPMVKSFLLVEP